MKRPHLVLASQSPRRRELLRLLGLPFDVTAARVDESPRPDETPLELVTRLSRAKACSADLHGRQEALVIACDTIVALEDGPHKAQILGKPGDRRRAIEMLRSLRGREHVVHSAVTTIGPTGHVMTQLVTTHLTMRRYTEDELRAYVASGDPLDKAGAYAIQHEGFDPVRNIEGCYASVMGLPLCHLAQSLRRQGRPPVVSVPAACQAYTGHQCTIHRGIFEV